jgi:16S rRNA (uracil1498-N3)-methyltransferase
MFIARIFLEHTLSESLVVNLQADHYHYLVHVIRVRVGDPLILWNGQGGEYESQVVNVTKKEISIRLNTFLPVDRESACQIEIVLPLLSSEKMDWVLQKSVELGVSQISPVLCERAVGKLNAEKLEKKKAHWMQVIISAANQSQRTQLPQLNDVRPFQSFFQQYINPIILFTPPLKDHVPISLPTHCQQCRILIGPESGFSDAELRYAQQNHAYFKTLGKRVLRVETAAISCMTYIQSLWGDF